MNISRVSSANDLWKLLEASQTKLAKNLSTSTAGTSSVTSAAGDDSSLSGAARFFSRLESLNKSNPAEFKKITAQVATQLEAAAKQSTNPSQASALNQLASNFQSASTTGHFSDLFSQGTGSGTVLQTSHGSGHHHQYHADTDSTSSASASGSESSTDPLSTIFSNALKQISTDLQASSSSPTTLA